LSGLKLQRPTGHVLEARVEVGSGAVGPRPGAGELVDGGVHHRGVLPYVEIERKV
jgi:hypothetical protein